MATALIKRILDKSIEQSVQMDWAIHHGLSAAVDEVRKGERYLLTFKLTNTQEFPLEKVEVRLSPSSSRSFGEHVEFFDSARYDHPTPSVVFRLDDLRSHRTSPGLTAYFVSRVNSKRGDGAYGSGLFRSTITARVVPFGTATTTERW